MRARPSENRNEPGSRAADELLSSPLNYFSHTLGGSADSMDFFWKKAGLKVGPLPNFLPPGKLEGGKHH